MPARFLGEEGMDVTVKECPCRFKRPSPTTIQERLNLRQNPIILDRALSGGEAAIAARSRGMHNTLLALYRSSPDHTSRTHTRAVQRDLTAKAGRAAS